MLREINRDCRHYFVDEQWRKQGEYKSWYDNGQIKEHCFFVNGKYHGEIKYWNKRGNLVDHCFYNNNELHGECKTWWNSGLLRSHDFFVNGKLHGEYKEWDENGEISRHCFYVDGKIISFSEIPYPKTPEELMLFKLKYDLQLLPVETKC